VSRRRRRGRGLGGAHGDETHGTGSDRWTVSYMDMVTVIMCLFIVLFAMSTVDKAKYEQLKESLAQGFGVAEERLADGPSGPSETPAPQLPDGSQPDPSRAAQQELDTLLQIKKMIEASLAAAGMSEVVGFHLDQRGLTVQLVGSETFFSPNDAALRPDAMAVLNAIGPVLTQIPNEISVEGNADPFGSSAPFPTDWELSAARATSVLRQLVEADGVPGARISLTGFGSARPLSGNAEQNRRVDIVILSGQSEDVRSLIPQLAQAQGLG